MKEPRKLVLGQDLTIGGDPEFFFKDKKTKKIIGSEKVIPLNGLGEYEETNTKKITQTVVRDGIQVELNPKSCSCRQSYQCYLSECFNDLNNHLKTLDNVELCFDQVVKVTKKELMSCSPSSRTFGCLPSFNIYQPKDDDVSKICVDPAKYLYRGGGGHIHLGTYSYDDYTRKLASNKKTIKALKQYDDLIPVLDILVGNFSVMIDRHPLNAERRKNYGRAGEYRRPSYGVEYRTLSNFWLRNTAVMSLIYGLARIGVYIVRESDKDRDFVSELKALVNTQDIKDAINNNDAVLARKNWDKIKHYIVSILPNKENIYNIYSKTYSDYYDSYSLMLLEKTIPLFEHFIDKGLDYWFSPQPEIILKHWITFRNNYAEGWERFLSNKVLKDYNKDKKDSEKIVLKV